MNGRRWMMCFLFSLMMMVMIVILLICVQVIFEGEKVLYNHLVKETVAVGSAWLMYLSN